jgi:cell division protein FtsQ
LITAFCIVFVGVAVYWGAYASSVFGVQRVEVLGASPDVVREVQATTNDLLGRSLVAVDAADVEGKIRALPSVAGVSVDRAFPHTLRIKIAPERAVAVARRGHSSWLVTGSGKVIREIATGSEQSLPRVWLGRGVPVTLGVALPAIYTPATRALAAARDEKLPRRVKAIRSTGGMLVLVLRHGPEIRLGEATDLALKAAVATVVFRLAGSDATYIDVSVPERPVAGH